MSDRSDQVVNGMSPNVPPISVEECKAPTKRVRPRILWQWSLAFTIAIFAFIGWQCGSGLIAARTLSNAAVERFHQQLNDGIYGAIYEEADETFRENGRKEQLIDFLGAVHAKLGNAGAPTLRRVNISATPSGTYITSVYNTTFTRGEAVETFTWLKSGGKLVLNGYNIQSNALLTR